MCDPLNYTVSLSPIVNQGPFITSDTSISLTGLVSDENNNLLVTIHPTNMAGGGSSLTGLITLLNIADAVPGSELLFLYHRGHYNFKVRYVTMYHDYKYD